MADPVPEVQTDTLVNLCTHSLIWTISNQNNKLAILDKLPLELCNKIVERLDFVSLQEIYYSQSRCYISSSQFSFRLYNQEKFCRQRIGTADARPFVPVHLLALATPIFDNLKPFHCAKRDDEEASIC